MHRTCIRTCFRILWYLQREHVRLSMCELSFPHVCADSGLAAYHWQELWRALVFLLDFLASKLDSLITTGGVEQLVQEVSVYADGGNWARLTVICRRYF